MTRRSMAIFGGLLVCSSALAHHSYAMFDNSKIVTMTLTVKKFDWANPHAWIYGVSKDDKGVESSWAIECRNPGELTRQGLRSIDIKPGDTVQADVWVARDGSTTATVIRASTSSGKKFGRTREDIEGTGQPRGPGPGVAP